MKDSIFAEYQATRRFGSLDGLRAIGILAVLTHHTAGKWAWLPMSQFERGFLGVDLFFVISGFLIVTLLLRERTANGIISLRQFYLRRTFRIWPLYYVILIVASLLFGVFKANPEMARLYWSDFPFLWTHTSNLLVLQVATPLFVAWSLATEEQFYLIWPALEKWLNSRVLWGSIFVGLFVNQVLNFQLANEIVERLFGPKWESLLVLQITLTPILLGVTLAHVLHDQRLFQIIRRLTGFRYASLVWSITLLILVNIPQEDIRGWLRLAIQLNMALLVSACVMREDHALRGILKFRPLARIGLVSYGIYLLHMFVLPVASMLLDRVGIRRTEAIFCSTLTLTWIAAEVSYRGFETRFLKFKKRFTPCRIALNEKELESHFHDVKQPKPAQHFACAGLGSPIE